jgi:hypothetical protein
MNGREGFQLLRPGSLIREGRRRDVNDALENGDAEAVVETTRDTTSAMITCVKK